MVPHSNCCGLCSPCSNSPLTLWAVRGYHCGRYECPGASAVGLWKALMARMSRSSEVVEQEPVCTTQFISHLANPETSFQNIFGP